MRRTPASFVCGLVQTGRVSCTQHATKQLSARLRFDEEAQYCNSPIIRLFSHGTRAKIRNKKTVSPSIKLRYENTTIRVPQRVLFMIKGLKNNNKAHVSTVSGSFRPRNIASLVLAVKMTVQIYNIFSHNHVRFE